MHECGFQAITANLLSFFTVANCGKESWMTNDSSIPTFDDDDFPVPYLGQVTGVCTDGIVDAPFEVTYECRFDPVKAEYHFQGGTFSCPGENVCLFHRPLPPSYIPHLLVVFPQW